MAISSRRLRLVQSKLRATGLLVDRGHSHEEIDLVQGHLHNSRAGWHARCRQTVQDAMSEFVLISPG